MRVLITGGAGYIGSHIAKYFQETGIEPVVFDDLSTGHAWAVQWGPLIKGDLSDAKRLRAALREHQIDAVVHLAASTSVGESMALPGKYYKNNLANTLTLLECMREAGVRRIVFSSTAAVYGTPNTGTISEAHPTLPTSVYGETKLAVENALRWYGYLHKFRWVSLRYFNAAGADHEGILGECHSPETHLIPLAIHTAMGHRNDLEIYGTDYPTHDGTAVRDYVHVNDLASGHRAALDYLFAGGGSFACNLGTGTGHSVREVVDAVERVARVQVPVRESERRVGDPPTLVADPGLANKVLGWKPFYSDLDTIVHTAFKWEHRLADAARRRSACS